VLPPRSSRPPRSRTTTLAPCSTAANAAHSPALPAPTTITSAFGVLATFLLEGLDPLPPGPDAKSDDQLRNGRPQVAAGAPAARLQTYVYRSIPLGMRVEMTRKDRRDRGRIWDSGTLLRILAVAGTWLEVDTQPVFVRSPLERWGGSTRNGEGTRVSL